MIKELLPIGSVVTLRGGVKKLMIIGMRVARSEEPEKYYDYMGVLYPEGFMGDRTTFLFDRTAINDVIFTGYDNPERRDLLEVLENAAADRQAPVPSEQTNDEGNG